MATLSKIPKGSAEHSIHAKVYERSKVAQEYGRIRARQIRLKSYYLNPKTLMEKHAYQPEELNASPKIAPCGWNPVAVGVAESPRCLMTVGNTDRPAGTPLSQVDKGLEWEPKSVISGFNWKHGMA